MDPKRICAALAYLQLNVVAVLEGKQPHSDVYAVAAAVLEFFGQFEKDECVPDLTLKAIQEVADGKLDEDVATVLRKSLGLMEARAAISCAQDKVARAVASVETGVTCSRRRGAA